MKKMMRLIPAALIAVLLLSACGSSPDPVEDASMAMEADMESGEQMADDDGMADSDVMMDDTAMDADDEMMDEADHSMEDDGTMMSEDDSMASDNMSDESAMDSASDDAVMSDSGEMSEAPMGAELAAWQQVALTDVRSGERFTLADFAGKRIFVETMATWCSNCRQQLNHVAQAKSQLSGDDVVFIALSVETNLAASDLAQYQQNQGFDWTFAVATPELLQMLADDFSRAILNPPSTPHFIIYPDGTIGELVTGIEPAEQLLAALNS